MIKKVKIGDKMGKNVRSKIKLFDNVIKEKYLQSRWKICKKLIKQKQELKEKYERQH